VIRQAISCDICGAEKKQTNRWFVVWDHGGELRVSGWNSRNRLRPGSKHLCGQTCLHKLVDDFLAKILAVRAESSTQSDADSEVEELVHRTDTSLTSDSAYQDFESSARLIPTPVREPIPVSPGSVSPVPVPPVCLPMRAPVELVSAPVTLRAEVAIPAEEPPRFASRSWRAEAWERERERELRAVERRPDKAARRRSGA
jgi:hypothetical protein